VPVCRAAVRVTEIENYLSVRHAHRPDRMRESFAAKALHEAPHPDLAPLAWGTPIQQNKARTAPPPPNRNRNRTDRSKRNALRA
jgi:hypothetical protein